jgi:hypothetical protein
MNTKIKEFIRLSNTLTYSAGLASQLFATDDPNLISEELDKTYAGEDYREISELANYIAHRPGLTIRNLINLSHKWNHGPNRGSFIASKNSPKMTPCEESFSQLTLSEQILNFLTIQADNYHKVRDALRLSKYIKLEGSFAEIRDTLATDFDQSIHSDGVSAGIYKILTIILSDIR